MREAYPGEVVDCWTTDQHRLGLKPILRRVWCRRGQRPTAVGQHRYQWCYLDAFVHPSSGRTVWLLLPTGSVSAFNVALAECAQSRGAGPGTQRLLGCDGAGWHVSPQGQLPVGVYLPLLPPYAPERQPADGCGL